MTTLELASVILTSEFAFATVLIAFLLRRQQRQVHHAQTVEVTALHEELTTHEPTRREALMDIFETTYGLRGRALAAQVDEYLGREKAFYEAMLNVYLRRDGKQLKDVPQELLKVLSPWVEIAPTAMRNDIVGALQSENVRLATELETNRYTIAKLLDEYNAAFHRHQIDKSEESASVPPPQELSTIQSTAPVLSDDASDELDFSSESIAPTDVNSDIDKSPRPMPVAEKAEKDDSRDADGLADLFDSTAPVAGSVPKSSPTN
ncbi:hypothetical protein HUU62_09695 [Rhodoferax sp. 4810]|uniref:Uncharacterized protein n=1 Tax=Thiospirillum jenense TaxID=1653858 RepID=A0A839H716_9GAMM|nr:hypothetical protein [Thiospirillum jenense]MBB1074681.1 hypothetical protein [Rhodoferax jenense]MBB1125475.1 hypothetical protein [Thiospirillum jenense]